jgi:phosphotransferase system HPr (HPr) family protein
MSTNPIRRAVVIKNPLGLHLRPAGVFVQKAQQFEANIQVIRESYGVDAKSIIDLVTLGASQGTQLIIEADGRDAQAAVDALADLVENSFGFEEKPE